MRNRKIILIKFKNIIFSLIFGFIFINLLFQYLYSASSIVTKTTEFLVQRHHAVLSPGTDDTVRTTGTWVCFNINADIIETSGFTLQNAFVEIEGLAYNSSGNHTISVFVKTLPDNCTTETDDPGAGATDYVVSGSTNPKKFRIIHSTYNGGAGVMSGLPTDKLYTLYVRGSAAGGVYSISLAKLKITYSTNASNTNHTKTTTFWITQQAGPITSGTNTSQNFSVSILENSPIIRSKFVEVSGVLKRTAQAATAEISVVKQGNPLVYTLYNLDLSATAGIITPFTILYPISSVEMPDSDFPTTRNYQFDFRGTGFDTYILQARAIITYKFSSGAGLYQATGTLESSVFDTATANGASFNSVSWNGVLNSGAVQFQLATSNCSGGQTNPPTCNTGTWTFYGDAGLGSGCNTTDYYDLSGVIGLDKAKSLLSCAVNINNKRYFKYKAKLCSASNCVSQTALTPQVNDVLVNWSP